MTSGSSYFQNYQQIHFFQSSFGANLFEANKLLQYYSQVNYKSSQNMQRANPIVIPKILFIDSS